MVGFLFDNCSGSLGIECIFNENRNIFMADRVNCRRINHFRSEIAKFHSLHIAQFFNRIGRTDHSRISGHESVHICPYLQNVRIKCCCNDWSRIVRASPSQIRHLTGCLVRRNKSWDNCDLGNFIKRFTNQSACQLRVKNVLVMFLFRLDEIPGIIPYSTVYQSRYNNRWKAFAIADNGGRCFRREIMYQINSLKNVFQLV